MKRLLPLLFVFAVNANAELTILDDYCMTIDEANEMLDVHNERIVSYGVSQHTNDYVLVAMNRLSGSYTILHEKIDQDEVCIIDHGVMELVQ